MLLPLHLISIAISAVLAIVCINGIRRQTYSPKIFWGLVLSGAATLISGLSLTIARGAGLPSYCLKGVLFLAGLILIQHKFRRLKAYQAP